MAHPLKGDEVETFKSGALLLNGEKKPLLPANLEILSPTLVRLEIFEGKYHQVKRMFASVSNRVINLHRVSFGDYKVDDIKATEFYGWSNEGENIWIIWDWWKGWNLDLDNQAFNQIIEDDIVNLRVTEIYEDFRTAELHPDWDQNLYDYLNSKIKDTGLWGVCDINNPVELSRSIQFAYHIYMIYFLYIKTLL